MSDNLMEVSHKGMKKLLNINANMAKKNLVFCWATLTI